MNTAGALPVLGKEGSRVCFDLDHLAGLVGVGAATREKVAELVTGHVTVPVARRADPHTGFRLAVGQ